MKLSLRKNGIYYISYLDNGKQFRISTKTNNLKIATVLLKQYESGVIKTKQQLLKIKTETVHNLVFEYLKYCEKHFTPKTMESLKPHLNTLIKSTSKTLDIQDLTFQTLNKIVSSFVSVYQSRLCRSYYSMFFNWLIDNGYFVGLNPVTKIKKPKITQKLPCYISEIELQKILDQTKNIDNEIVRTLVYDICKFAFYTGFRITEITSLKWSQINFSNQTIVLDNQTNKTKSGKIRVVPISSKILPMLEVRYNHKTNELVFSHSFSNRGFNTLISKNFKKIIRSLPDINQSVHFHSLRHSFASNLVNHNVNILTVSKLLGHQNIATTLIYSHISDNVLKEAINVL